MQVVDIVEKNGEDVLLVLEYYNIYIESNNSIRVPKSYKTLRFNKEYSDYVFEDVDENCFEEMFPSYYYKKVVYDNDNYNYYINGDNVIVSGGDILAYYKDGQKKFEVTNENYSGFGKAKIYNNLIIAIGYLNNKDTAPVNGEPIGMINTDILFYDLDGNFIGNYESNAYNYDVIFDDERLIVSNLYVDGICGIGEDLYHKWNVDCKAVFVNDVYAMDEEYLGMALSASNTNKGEIKNPETLPDVNDFIMLVFISLIILVMVRLIRPKFKKI